jgi:hypothetical protein
MNFAVFIGELLRPSAQGLATNFILESCCVTLFFPRGVMYFLKKLIFVL